MSKQFPTSGSKWMTNDGLDDWKQLSCIVEVDLEYPEHLRNLDNDYPLTPERVKIELWKTNSKSEQQQLITLCIMKI